MLDLPSPSNTIPARDLIMSSSQSGSGSGRQSSTSRLSRLLRQDQNPSAGDCSDNEDLCGRASRSAHRRQDPSPSRAPFSSPLNQTAPARSYFQRPVNGSYGISLPLSTLRICIRSPDLAPVDIVQTNAQGVREDTAELASFALSDVASLRSHSPSRQHIHLTANNIRPHNELYLGAHLDQDHLSRCETNDPSRPGVIQEVSEPVSPESSTSSQKSPHISSLSELIRKNSSPTEGSMDTDNMDGDPISDEDFQVVTVNKGIISQPSERTGLLLRNAISGRGEPSGYNTISDLERQSQSGTGAPSRVRSVARSARRHTSFVFKRLTNPKTWDRQVVWKYGIRQPISYIPPVILGLLLNILDALSYGKRRLESRLFSY